jgi:hypothetical protein
MAKMLPFTNRLCVTVRFAKLGEPPEATPTVNGLQYG